MGWQLWRCDSNGGLDGKGSPAAPIPSRPGLQRAWDEINGQATGVEDQDGFSGETLAFRPVEIQLASQPQNSLELNKGIQGLFFRTYLQTITHRSNSPVFPL